MKFIKQFSIILLITFLGELLHILIPLPIPASVYGLVLMLIALRSGLVKVEHVKETAVFLIEIMPVMFYSGGGRTFGILGRVTAHLAAGMYHYRCHHRDRHGCDWSRDTGNYPG